MKKIQSIGTKIVMFRKGDNPVFGDSMTEFDIDDEGGGIFITVDQVEAESKLKFDIDEIDEVVSNLKRMKELCKFLQDQEDDLGESD